MAKKPCISIKLHKYKIHLSEEERETLTKWVKKGAGKAKIIQQAQVLLGSDEQTGKRSALELAENYHLSERSVERIRKQFFEEGMMDRKWSIHV